MYNYPHMRYIRLFFTYVLALIFLAASIMKFTGSSMEVAIFQKIGYGMWFMYFTAVLELAGAVLTITRKYRVIGLSLIALVCLGAFIAQVTVLKEDWIHTVVLGGLAALLAYNTHKNRQILNA